MVIFFLDAWKHIVTISCIIWNLLCGRSCTFNINCKCSLFHLPEWKNHAFQLHVILELLQTSRFNYNHNSPFQSPAFYPHNIDIVRQVSLSYNVISLSKLKLVPHHFLHIISAGTQKPQSSWGKPKFEWTFFFSFHNHSVFCTDWTTWNCWKSKHPNAFAYCVGVTNTGNQHKSQQIYYL